MHALLKASRQLPLATQLTGVLAVVTVATAIQLMIPAVAFQYPFLFFFAANAVNGALWRRPVAVGGLLLATLSAAWFIIEPRGTIILDQFGSVVAVSVFLVVGLCEVLILAALVGSITELDIALRRAREAEAQKALLTEEANHRIKNNLQLIASFLNLEAGASQDSKSSATLRSAAARLYTVGQIHDQLSKSAGPRVALDQLLSALCAHLTETMAAESKIELVCDARSKAIVPAKVGTTVGVLANELVTNALKHAFEEGGGTIRVGLERKGDDLTLVIADNGRGLKEKKFGSGSRFVVALTRELDGALSVDGNKGTRVEIRFPLPAEQPEADEVVVMTGQMAASTTTP